MSAGTVPGTLSIAAIEVRRWRVMTGRNVDTIPTIAERQRRG
jgi:hypothetical protein